VAQRDRLKEALRFRPQGDTLVVCKPDRLARSITDFLRILDDLERRGVGLIMLSMGDQRIATAQMSLAPIMVDRTAILTGNALRREARLPLLSRDGRDWLGSALGETKMELGRSSWNRADRGVASRE
jgi:hypothetical protein